MTKKQHFYRRLLTTMIEGRRQQAKRHVERYLKALGLEDPNKP